MRIDHNATYTGLTSMVVEWVHVLLEGFVLSITPGLGDGVASDTGNFRLRLCDSLAVLDIETFDLGKGTAGTNELCDYGERLAGIDGLALAVEVGYT